jgi:hypothetical protein
LETVSPDGRLLIVLHAGWNIRVGYRISSVSYVVGGYVMFRTVAVSALATMFLTGVSLAQAPSSASPSAPGQAKPAGTSAKTLAPGQKKAAGKSAKTLAPGQVKKPISPR